jgi:hypothetical protein
MIVIKRLTWDDWNINHIARHQVTPAEVEAACHSDFVLLILRGKKGRLVLIGSSRRRLLAIVLDPEPTQGVYYPVTAYTASRKLRRIYEQIRKGGETR